MEYWKFIEDNKLSPDSIDTEAILNFFDDEMFKGLCGKESSLKMIPTYATTEAELKKGESVIVMDAGGTNFRTCLVTFREDGTPEISDFRKIGMPGAKEEVSGKEFYSILADNIERFMGKSKKIGFCFSYAAEITEDHDGIPLMFSKEIKAPEVIGKPIGKSLIAELQSRGYDTEGMTVSIVNDTVATLLAAKAASSAPASAYVGFILGTGTNTAYVEKNENIRKIALEEGSQIINVESGCLRLVLSDHDEEFMKTTNDPTSYHLEKKISGAYLGPFAYFTLKKAVKEGVFSEAFAEKFASVEGLETKDLSVYLATPGAPSVLSDLVSEEDDSIALFSIVKAIVTRSAKLTALNLTAAVLATDEGKTPERPVVINADGTTFYKTTYLELYTRKYLEEILVDMYGRFYSIVTIENSPTIGAAIAGLSL